ncbi:hypothetical protein AZL_002290 [Azospirillum sp. B510]|uniref:hypothetical protein n=1 Tax=Azospirillum sp. (strain B510) TaxID=137722 RepID=UPI0001C4C234|nr:hypothetical protein [Azospirillum sp. B510]BAI70867.1 hypothetical protein AZL_002290 [Azospirillum sp. B510]
MTKPRNGGNLNLPEQEVTVRLLAARIVGRDGWHLEESTQDADGFREALAQRGMAVAELVEIEHWTLRVPADEPFTPSNRFHDTAYRAGWGYDAGADCWHASHERDRRFPGPTLNVDRLDVTYALPDVGWIDTTIRAGERVIEFSMSEVFDPIPALLNWLERLAGGSFGRISMDVEGWYVDFHCFAEGDRVRFVVEEGWDGRSMALDIRIDRIALLAGLYCPLVALWESDAFARAYMHWDFASVERDTLDPAWERRTDDDDPERLTPIPIRSPRIDAVLRAAGWNW